MGSEMCIRDSHSASRSNTPDVHTTNNLAHREGGSPVPSVRCLRPLGADVTVAYPTDADVGPFHGVVQMNYLTRTSVGPMGTCSGWSAIHYWTTGFHWRPGPGFAIYLLRRETDGYFPAKVADCFRSNHHGGSSSFSGWTAKDADPLVDESHWLYGADSW